MSEAAENLTNEVMSTCPICEKPVTRTDSRKLVGGTNVGGQHGVEMIDQQLAHTACADGEAPGGALFAATEPLTQPDEPAEEVSRLFDVEGIDPIQGLVDLYMVPPFTILDRRQGYWQQRGRQWRGLGIQSELGRTAMGGGISDPALQRGGSGFGGQGEYGSGNPTPEQHAEYRRQAKEGVKGPMQGKGGLKNSIEWERRVREENREARRLGEAKMEGGVFNNPADWQRSKSRGERSVATMNHLVPNHLEREASIFDPVLCEIAYEWFCPQGGRILDPFAGGSVRGIVAGWLGFPYVGIDLSERQIEANREQAERIFSEQAAPRIKPRWIPGDSRDVLPRAQSRYDFVFSCPPYGDLEVYSDDPRDISTMLPDDFDAAYAEIIGKAVGLMADNSFAAFVVGNYRIDGRLRDLCGITIDAFEEAGAHYYNEIITIDPIGTAAVRVGTMFRASRKTARVHQQMLVFCKGDPKAATAKLPTMGETDDADDSGDPNGGDGP
jgi:hypothetical protein